MQSYFCVILMFYGLLTCAKSSVSSPLWRDCTRDRNSSPMKITHIDITPRPVQLPGEILFSMSGYTTRSVGSTEMSLRIVRKTFLMNIPIPCIQNIGSCTYPDVCTLLDDMIREDWAGILSQVGADIKQMLIASGVDPDQCLQPAQSFHINQQILPLPRLPRVLSWFAAGDYSATLSLKERSTGREILCLELDLNLQQRNDGRCIGYFCFGN